MTNFGRSAIPLVVAGLVFTGAGAFVMTQNFDADAPAPMPSTMAVQSPGRVTPVSDADAHGPVAGPTLSDEELAHPGAGYRRNLDKSKQGSDVVDKGTDDPANAGPMELRIPALDADMPVIARGTRTGELKTGQERDMLRLSDQYTGVLATVAAPCKANAGTTVIASHNQLDGDAGPLYDLYKLPAGAAGYLTCGDGTTTKWKQTSSELTAWADLDQKLFTRTGPRRLVVITCTGRFGEGDNVVKIFTPVS